MSRIRVTYPFLGHDRVEEINNSIVVGHETPFIFQFVEEDVLAVDPDVRIPNLTVDRDFSLDLVARIVLGYPKVRFAELAVAATAPHDLDEPMGRGTLNV